MADTSYIIVVSVWDCVDKIDTEKYISIVQSFNHNALSEGLLASMLLFSTAEYITSPPQDAGILRYACGTRSAEVCEDMNR